MGFLILFVVGLFVRLGFGGFGLFVLWVWWIGAGVELRCGLCLVIVTF